MTTGDANKVYSYDNVGNITDIVDSNHPQVTAAYRYDGLDRMTTNSIAGTGSWSYTYDANGNRTSSSGLPFVHSTTSNRLNNIPASPVVYFGYDAAGNQTSRGGATFVYDNVGRMVKTTEGSTVLGTYTYNAIGQRMQKTVSGVVTRLVYDEAGHILGEYDGTGKMVPDTVYLGDWPAATVRLNSAGTAVAYYVWPDHLGSPKQVTDPATNKVVWRWEANPFGPSPNPYEDPQGTGNTFVYNLRLPGQYWDKEISRSSNGFREYDPYMGRYIQSDPIGLRGGVNTYAYSGGNPISFNDPSGLDISYANHQVAFGMLGTTRTVSPEG